MATTELDSAKSSPVKIPIGPVLFGWLIPGGGHFYQRRWGRGALLLLSIGALFLAGVTMRGRMFELAPANIVESLGYLSELGSGLLFLATKFAGYNPEELAAPAADFGTKFLLVAGLLN